MNPVIAQLKPTDRPETPCTDCKNSIWYIGTPSTEKTALAALCGVLGQQIYNSQGDGRMVQACASLVLDD
jgi:hypothetical protein